MEIAQKHVELPCKRLITPFKNRFVYLIHSFRYLLESKGSINYLYVSMDNIPDKKREQNHFLEHWSVTNTDAMTMPHIVGIIVKIGLCW